MLEEVTSIVNKPPSVGEAVGAGVGVVVGAGVGEVDSSTATIVATAKQNAKATRRYLRDFAGGCDFAGGWPSNSVPSWTSDGCTFLLWASEC